MASTGTKSPPTMTPFQYACDIDAEPLHRYTRGGYHPTHLGDQLNDRRYRVLHKLGWGGYSTVWAARDQHLGRYVAVKISVSERQSAQIDRQLHVMRTIATSSLKHPGAESVTRLLDHFELDGPNGTHECLVLELLGPSVPAVLDVRFVDNRLPAKLAKKVARQTLLGLDYLHQHAIGHGESLSRINYKKLTRLDLHTGNIAFTLPLTDSTSEDELARILGKPELGQVRRVNGEKLGSGIPEYLVRPSVYPLSVSSLPDSVKIVDYGESFFDAEPPATLHTPLAVRAPEIVFGDRFDHRVDLWSMACLVFELYTGQPPFDFGLTPGTLIAQMEEFAADRLPERWIERANRLREPVGGGTDQAGGKRDAALDTEQALQQWLEEVYFDDGRKKAELSLEDIRKVGDLVRKMLWFEPSSRETASRLLTDTWLS
ncbi:Serine/threonine-protein kinase-like protein [Hapsidospora chrysogenum ATCC 11550]|uniref:non-specific serine/threonine protein kinase n=1 Tax=Hapsidospora chrysogenum (strain ATCC 11550 / CBS 779.69 / DSM 880 / IAM 14645 / JCM 23072 / IMI 49137) TaxID=857340 RepID=A0A086ST06_HAPC1|nr:Serine/threonine-protein kinase-like protein [Hapsidospora chrysogenum ATCC 11550]